LLTGQDINDPKDLKSITAALKAMSIPPRVKRTPRGTLAGRTRPLKQRKIQPVRGSEAPCRCIRARRRSYRPGLARELDFHRERTAIDGPPDDLAPPALEILSRLCKNITDIEGPIRLASRQEGPALVGRHDAMRVKKEKVAIGGKRHRNVDAKLLQLGATALVDGRDRAARRFGEPLGPTPRLVRPVLAPSRRDRVIERRQAVKIHALKAAKDIEAQHVFDQMRDQPLRERPPRQLSVENPDRQDEDCAFEEPEAWFGIAGEEPLAPAPAERGPDPDQLVEALFALRRPGRRCRRNAG